jgi:hypothetical protein
LVDAFDRANAILESRLWAPRPQSLADLQTSVEAVEGTRRIPVTP